MSCSATIETRVETESNYNAWKASTTRDLTDLATTSNEEKLNQVETDIFNTIECLRSKIAEIKQAPTNVANIQEAVVALQGELLTKEKQLEVAKQRALSISHPERATSDYEGWFPLGRPMRPTSLFLLIGFSLFFLLFFFGILMSFLGFNIQLSWMVPGATAAVPRQGWLGMIMGWINPLSLAAILAVVITGSLLIWMGTK
jgi:hypothetical protein